jgi:segregation and condensation protein B
VIYATTPEFLQHFGLESRRDLPGIDELRAAGLLDPVDDAYDLLMTPDEEDTPGEAEESAEEPETEVQGTEESDLSGHAGAEPS